jgi:hypothetical protein
MGGIVDAPGDERPIEIAPKKGHHDLHAHARHEARAPSATGPGLRDANPARAVLVVTTLEPHRRRPLSAILLETPLVLVELRHPMVI